MDAHELEHQAKAWGVVDRLLRSCEKAERTWSLDPILLDRVDDAVGEYLDDITNEHAREKVYLALSDFAEAVQEAMN
jgi:hypothetical protein